MINSRNLEELHPCLQRGAQELMRRMKNKGYPVLITATYRDNEYQNYLYAQGRTRSGNIVTNAKGGQSIHNHRLAFDICKNIKGQEYSDREFFNVAGAVWESMGGEWGGSWTGFVDKPHFQYLCNLTLSQLQKGYTMAHNARMLWENVQLENIMQEDEEMVDRMKIKIDGNIYEVNRILKDDLNYVELQGLKQAGIGVDYDESNKIPELILPKK